MISFNRLKRLKVIFPSNQKYLKTTLKTDIYGGTPDLHYVVYNKHNGEIGDLKSEFLFKRIKDPENIDFDTIDSYSIDILTFRQIFEPY